ncbi:alpha,alpha-phosphotrehalase [Marinilactibacillus psychrotolerans]|uniref:Alpha,alpha-phosphotrehalase n=1 Tax=Marinilactibacillus psychrotolerans TaxID=191770 RepID=A0AAV3WTF1_9LACT|nr:alpha,alpha-phosphotrehalase [Marinilactibacillus psychrotolerans]GEL66537.1 glucohydrolase [Marinilactibacillus psychrotolerans]GEQ35353.1 alpha, alpha-phosphotrehalase [Marinilactibacillus psychrotolerans]SDC50435.1 trehalose-6-phosphate hydrolase [Marinilactibacillus psychrotolerans]
MTTFHDKVIYQVYPKSFKDTDGNGIGDLRGIIEKLPYLEDLGVDMLWLNPFYKSPQNDNGYDVADYTSIDPLFGSWADFDTLVQEAEKRGITLMLDMVLNHTSTEHEWFQKALSGDKKYQDYYILREAQSDGSLPTNWESKFGGPAWSKFADTNLYYLHLYDKTQADLNWRNPEMRKELYEAVNFWLEKGVKGLRFDVINVIGKAEKLEDAADGVGKSHYTDTPIVHDYIKELSQKTFGKYENIITVGEMSSTTVNNGIKYSTPESNELSMIFSFHHLKVDYKDGEKWTKMPFDFLELKKLLDEWQRGMDEGDGWNAVFWNNHDQPRANSRFGDVKNYPIETATMLAQTIHLLRGTPYIYQGEEIGMTNPNYDQIEDYVDIETHNAYKELKDKGLAENEIMEIIQEKSRDNSRTPMQWNTDENAGFSSGEPWLKVPKNYTELNTENELISKKIRDYYKELIQLRKEYLIIQEGSYEPFELGHQSVFGYIREYEQQKLLVLNHFYADEAIVKIPKALLDMEASYLIGNKKERILEETFTMEPYETVAFLLN